MLKYNWIVVLLLGLFSAPQAVGHDGNMDWMNSVKCVTIREFNAQKPRTAFTVDRKFSGLTKAEWQEFFRFAGIYFLDTGLAWDSVIVMHMDAMRSGLVLTNKGCMTQSAVILNRWVLMQKFRLWRGVPVMERR